MKFHVPVTVDFHFTGQTLLLNLAFTKPEFIKEVTSLSLLNSNGTAMKSFTIDRGQGIYSGSYYVLFTPSSERFRFQLTGKTTDGKILRRIKPTEIQIEEVQLDFNYRSVNYSRRISPGITANIPLKIKNMGNSQNLTLKAMDDLGFIKSLVPNYLFVAENETAQFSLVMRAPANASSGETSTVTVYTTLTSSGQLSNYMVFYVSVTTTVSTDETTGDFSVWGQYVFLYQTNKRTKKTSLLFYTCEPASADAVSKIIFVPPYLTILPTFPRENLYFPTKMASYKPQPLCHV